MSEKKPQRDSNGRFIGSGKSKKKRQPAEQPKKILAYKPDEVTLPAEALTELRKAGYIPLPVENPKAVRVIEPMSVGSMDVLGRAALKAIGGCKGAIEDDHTRRRFVDVLTADLFNDDDKDRG